MSSSFDGQHYVFTADNSQVLASLQQINGAMQGSQQFAQNAQAQAGGNAATKAFYAQQTATHKAALQEQIAEAKTGYAALANENKAYWQTQVAQAKFGFSALQNEQKHGYATAISAQKSAQQIALANTKSYNTQVTNYQKALNSAYTSGIKSHYTQVNASHKAGLDQAVNQQRTANAQIVNNQRHTNATLLQQQKHADAVRLAQLRADLAERARLNRQGSGGGGVGSQIGIVAAGNILANAATRALSEAFNLLTSSVAAAGSAVASFIQTGLEYSTMIETTGRAIQTLITANYELQGSNGQVLTGMQEFVMAGTIANEAIEKLRVAALESPLSFQELLLGFQQTAAQAEEAGIKVEELVPLTLKLGGAVKTLGLDTRQVQQEIRAILTGRVGPSEQLGRVLGVNNELIKQWKEQGTLVKELSERLEPFTFGLEDAKRDMDVLSSSAKDVYDNIARLATLQLFESAKAALYEILTGLTTAEGKLEEPLARALVVLDDLSGKAGYLGELLAEKVVGHVIELAEWIEYNKVQIGETGDAAIQVLISLVNMFESVLRLVGSIFGVNEQVVGSIERQNSALNAVQAILGFIQLLLDGIAAICDIIAYAMDSWVGTLIRAVLPLQQIAQGMRDINAEAAAARNQAAQGAAGLRIADEARRRAEAISAANQRGGGAGGGGRGGGGGGGRGGGGGGGGSNVAEQRERALKQYALKAEKDTLDSLLGINQDLAKIEFERLQALVKLSEEAKKYKFSQIDIERITRQINENAKGDTERAIEKNRLAQEEYELDLQMRQLKLQGRDVDAEILEMDAKKQENYRKLTEMYRVGEQAKIDALQKQYETLLSQEAVMKRWAVAVKEVLNDFREIDAALESMGINLQALADKPLPFETDFDFIEKTKLQLAGLVDLSSLTGDAVLGIGRRLQELGTTVEQLAIAFGHAASTSEQLYQQMDAMERFGPTMQKVIGSLQAATEQALATAQDLTAMAIPNMFSLIGESLGNALAGVEDFGKAFRDGMFKLIADLCAAWGRYYILQGTLNLFWNPALGAAQIAGGIALTALGAFLSAKAGGGATATQTAGATSSTTTSSPTQDAGPPPIPRRQFNTSGESRFGQPIWFGPDSSYYGGDSAPVAVVEVRVGEGVVMNTVVRGVSRGSGRVAMRRARL